MKIKTAKATFNFTEHFDECVQELLDDPESGMENEEQIKEYLTDCMEEDIIDFMVNNPRLIDVLDFQIEFA
jgi:DNA-binding phage protein